MHRNKTKGYINQPIKDKMTRAIKFTKMHGAGNDYIYVDTTQIPTGAIVKNLRGHGVHRIRELEVTVWYLSVLRTMPISACGYSMPTVGCGISPECKPLHRKISF